MSIASKPVPTNPEFSSEERKALPTKAQVLEAIPPSCFQRSLIRSSAYAAVSVALTLSVGMLAYHFLPREWAYLPVWLLYAMVCGTVATGCWVIAHECGHRAFCASNLIQDTVGYVLHSALLVPYFSWQRSHAVHHARTNHLDEGETFVPARSTSASGMLWQRWEQFMGDEAFAIVMMVARFTVGWPVYLMTGASGGPVRGTTNHFWPVWPFSTALFPGRWRNKVWWS
ncbi:MAG: fatty acid desaturase, partial [Planctomycetales bacterium]|nr:fatty acid desaturase [Planctomycetales bacterium]